MSERIYVDPVTRSAREERALFNLINKLDKSVGQFTRLGVITYCRSLAEGGFLAPQVLEEFNKVMQRDVDYLEKLRNEKIRESICQTELLTQEVKEDPLIRVYDKADECFRTIPESKFSPDFYVKAPLRRDNGINE